MLAPLHNTDHLIYVSIPCPQAYTEASFRSFVHFLTYCLSSWNASLRLFYTLPRLWWGVYVPCIHAATSCFGSDASQFPSSNLFGSAGEGIWDNGAACGRQYLVRCISAAVPKTCIPGKTIQIKIVDRALSSVSRPSRNDATMVLSTTAFAAIANSSASFVNVEFQQ